METNNLSKLNQRGSLFGILSFVTAVLAAGSVLMIGLTSFTNFNPPDWLRILTMAPLPFALLASLGFGLAGLKSKAGRTWAISGLALVALSIVGFIVMIAAGGS